MNIHVRLGGGAGDCLLGHRFCCAIKEKYPKAEISAWIDANGEDFQRQLLMALYPSFYKKIINVPFKKYKECWIISQFGEEQYKGAIENIPDSISKEMYDCDKFYDLNIDAMKWPYYDFDYLRWFKFFPKPELPKIDTNENYVVLHLASNSFGTKNDHTLNQDYLENLINLIIKISKVKIICTKDIRSRYSIFENNPQVEIIESDVKTVCQVISGTKAMVSVDSGWKYVGYSYDIPTLCMSKHVQGVFQPIPSHYLRWLMVPESCLPLHFSEEIIVDLLKKFIMNKAYALMPTFTDFDNQAVKRIYSIHEEKSILNI